MSRTASWRRFAIALATAIPLFVAPVAVRAAVAADALPVDIYVGTGRRVMKIPAGGGEPTLAAEVPELLPISTFAVAPDGAVIAQTVVGSTYRFLPGQPTTPSYAPYSGFTTFAYNSAGDEFSLCVTCTGVGVIRSGSDIWADVPRPGCDGFFPPLSCVWDVPIGLAVDQAENVFVADSGNGRVVMIPGDGGQERDVATGLERPVSIAPDGLGNVVIVDQQLNVNQVVEQVIYRVPIAGGPRETLLSGAGRVRSVSADGFGNIYAIVDRQVVRISPTGATQVVDLGLAGPVDLIATAPRADAAVEQLVDADRPAGALVLTQVCGARGALPTAPGSSFPWDLPSLTANHSSTVGDPTVPGDDTSLTPPVLVEDGDPLVDADPRAFQYPYPTDASGVPNPATPTYCGIDLGIAELITEGPGAGQFFAADGALNQVTIVDTRDGDVGWVASGHMSRFTANGGTDSFAGSQLGWTPVVTDDTEPFTDSLGFTYDQTVAPGPRIDPNLSDDSGVGRPNGRTLAQASNAGLGIAVVDARLTLLIPITADAGAYDGVLTITVI